MIPHQYPGPILGSLLKLLLHGLKSALKRARLRWSFSKNGQGQVESGVEVDLGGEPQQHCNPYDY